MREKVLHYIRDQKLMRAGDRVAVAVSGGADSVALLRLLLELQSELGIVLAVAHFNHGLRGEASLADEAFVAELVKEHALDFFARHGKVRDHAFARKLSLEAAGRELRYRWFGDLAGEQRFDAIATAHTLDDQAETVLLKFLRGAGTRGLAGIYPVLTLGVLSMRVQDGLPSQDEVRNQDQSPNKHQPADNPQPANKDQLANEGEVRNQHQTPNKAGQLNQQPGAQGTEARRAGSAVSPGRKPWVQPQNEDESRRDGTVSLHSPIRVVRPLLQIARAEVEAYLTSLGQPWREDESNRDRRFLRNRVRHELLPLLLEYNPNLRQTLSDAADLSRAEDEYWQALVGRELASRINPAPDDDAATAKQFSLDAFAQLPTAVQRRLLKRFTELQGLTLDFEQVENLRRCALGETATAELPGAVALRIGGSLQVSPPRQEHTAVSNYEYVLPVPGQVRIHELGLTLRALTIPEQFVREAADDCLLRAAALAPHLIVRNWRPGDRFRPAHRRSAEKLKRLFAEKHIPTDQRPSWPVVLSSEEIVWVRDFPMAHEYVWKGQGPAVKIEAVAEDKGNFCG